MMEAKEIKTVQDAQTYLEGVLNDFEAGIATKSETMKYLAEYTAKVFELSRVKKPHDVVGRSELLRDYFAWHEEKVFVSHKPSDIDEFLSEQ
jgi:hypothetical protein